MDDDGSWSETKLDEVFQSPIAKVLDPEFYIGRRFYEPVLVASIFRSLRPHDVMPPSQAELLMTQVKMLLKNRSNRHLYGELALAMARGHLPITFRDLLPECYRRWL